MKLLDLLKQDLKVWPEGMFYAVQDYDGDVKFGSKSSKCDAFIDGGVWLRGNDGNEVTMIFNKVSCDYKTSKVTKEQWEDAKELLTKQDTTQKKHKHSEMIAMCAEFAQTMENPMAMFQYKGVCDKEWQNIPETGSVIFYKVNEYRLKPKTKLINGVEIPDLPFTPFVGCEFYCANVGLPEFYETGYMGSECCTFTKRMVERGLIYPYTEEGKQAAILHSKSLLNITGE